MEEIVEGTGHDAWVVLRTQHGVGLTGPRGPIGKHCGIEPTDHVGDEETTGLLVHLILKQMLSYIVNIMFIVANYKKNINEVCSKFQLFGLRYVNGMNYKNMKKFWGNVFFAFFLIKFGQPASGFCKSNWAKK